MTGALCSARLRNGDRCRSVATHDEFCASHAALADELGNEVVANGDQLKRRNARQRVPVLVESEPLELPSRSPGSPSAVRPALALTAAEELETIRAVLLEAATSTTRETWATCTCPECGKGFRQEMSVPDHGARIKAIETLLREGLGRVGENISQSREFLRLSRSCGRSARRNSSLLSRSDTQPRSATCSTTETMRFAPRSRAGSRRRARSS
jgi:hypothetical protein